MRSKESVSVAAVKEEIVSESQVCEERRVEGMYPVDGDEDDRRVIRLDVKNEGKDGSRIGSLESPDCLNEAML